MQTEILTRQSDVIQALRKEAASFPALNAVCHLFAMRERARAQVTLAALRYKMAKEKFYYPQEDYVKVLEFLARIGIGKLKRDFKGRVVGLTDIKYTLQSIGKVTVAKTDDFEKFVAPTKYKELAPVPQPGIKAPLKEPVVKVTFEEKKDLVDLPQRPEPQRYPVYLMATIAGKKVEFATPMQLTAEEIGALVVEMHGGPK